MIVLAVAHLLRWILSGLLCGATVLCGVWFLIRHGRILRSTAFEAAPAELQEKLRKRAGRRRYGATLVILIAAMFFVALNLLDPNQGADPNAAVGVWSLVLLLLVVLVLLAMADLRHTLTGRSLRDIELNEQLVRALTKHLQNQGKAGAARDGEKTSEKGTSDAKSEDGGNGREH